MKDLTPRQAEIYQYIRDYLAQNKFAPAFRDVAGNFGISVRAAFDHIRALEKKGVIRCSKNRSRAMELCEDHSDDREELEILRIPVLGTVAAGLPIMSEENIDYWLSIPSDQLAGGSFFALNVKGDSMVEDGIMAGDVAVIRQQAVAENGDIVVALLDDAVTLKHFFRQPNRIMLRAANPNYPDTFYTDVRILGKLHQIIRRYR